jgi:pimeloyl-ACP methyl ester carboxylesterase
MPSPATSRSPRQTSCGQSNGHSPSLPFTEPSGDPAWKTVPSWYLVSTNDHAIPPATQWFMAQRAHANIATVKASHVPMISHPEVTTDLILEAARSVS